MTRDRIDRKPNRVLAIFLHGYEYGKALGGVERRFIEVSRNLASQGIQMYALEYSPALSRAFPSGYHSIEVAKQKPRTAVEEAFQIIRLSVLSAFWCRRLKCELIYSPSSVYQQVIPSLFASVLLRVPLVVVFHSAPYSRLRASFGSILRSRLTSRDSLRKALLKTSIEYLRGIAYAHASTCIAVSNSTAQQIYRSFTPQSVIVSGNGVSEDWFDRKTTHVAFDGCFLGRITARKGIDLLLLSWRQVLLKYPNAKLVLIGGSEDPRYLENVRKTIQTLELSRNVTLTGFLEDEFVRSTLRSSKVFVLPSSREGFGLAIIEAMASGLPCVLPSLPSLKENFAESAVFVDRPEPEAWAGAICALLGDEETRARLSNSGMNLASHFRWQMVSQKEAQLMSHLIQRRR
jgi:glycosyltransferase involved in cell wall biosynthesis